MGCWDTRRAFALRDVLLPLAGLVVLLSVPYTRNWLGLVTELLAGFGDMVIWGEVAKSGWEMIGRSALGLVLALLLMVLIWDTFVPFGRLLGRLMNDHPNTIRAYSVNVTGSLVGIWVFVALSAATMPPVVWFGAFAAVAVCFAGSGGRSKVGDYALLSTIVVVSILAGWNPGYPETYWSPYQKLSIRPAAPNESGSDDIGVVRVNVNNSNYQEIIDLRPETVAADPEHFVPALRGLSQYDLPCQFHPKPDTVLVVGAGSGNDVTGALRNGAKRVVAVEIDPVIIDVGRRYNPEKPYSDPRVQVVNDDARSYFATSNEKFDVIIFGLLDSHTTTAMTNARLDHYVYTRESLARAKELLAPGGVMVLSFYAERQFITDRMARTIAETFGRESLVFRVTISYYGRGGWVFVNGNLDAVNAKLAADPRLDAQIKTWKEARHFEITGTTSVATDDWPYIYLEKPNIPVLYFLLAGTLALLFARGLYRLNAAEALKSWGGSSWHFFFLGAAFMLLEVQNISKAAVVLGNTWAVNAVIISGVMVMILLANFVAARFPRLPLTPVYALLVLSCLGLYFLDLSSFAFLPYPAKAALVGLLTSLPMLFSGIVFIRSFAVTERKDTALGANLMGALVGGLLQSITFLTGIKALLLIVAALYLVAVLTRPRSADAPAPVTA
jgi:spermidine synthase